MSKRRAAFVFAVLIITIQILGGWATASSVSDWYPALQKAAWNPPAWVFGPVWTALYIMICLSGWRIWCRLHEQSSITWHARPLTVYFLQLAANLAWSLLFFGLRSPLAGLLDMTLLLALIVWCITLFYRIDRIASWLLMPYMLWVCYAYSLNAMIVALN